MWVCIAKAYLLPENFTFSSKTTSEEIETAFFTFESLSLVDEYLVHNAADDHEESFKRGTGIRGREKQGLTCQLTPAASKMCSFKLKIRSRFLIVEIYHVIWQEKMKSVIFFFSDSSNASSFSNFKLNRTVFAGRLWCPYLKNITPSDKL